MGDLRSETEYQNLSLNPATRKQESYMSAMKGRGVRCGGRHITTNSVTNVGDICTSQKRIVWYLMVIGGRRDREEA